MTDFLMKRISNSTIGISTIVMAIAVLAVFKVPGTFSAIVEAQPSITSTAPPVSSDSILLKQLRASQLTVGELIDSLASPDQLKRNNADVAILALRSHYMREAAQIAFSSPSIKSTGASRSNALETLAFLRPADPQILSEADQNIDFTPATGHVHFETAPSRGAEYPAAGLLVRASFAALPILRNDFKIDLIQPGHPLTEQQRLRLQCAVVILGPCAPSWFYNLAVDEKSPAAQKSLLYCSLLVTAKQTRLPGQSLPPPTPSSSGRLEILRGFQYADELNRELDTSDLDQIDPGKYVIDWNASSRLADEAHFATDRPLPPWPSERNRQSVVALHEIERTMALLSYSICLRLNSDENLKSKQKPVPLSEDAAAEGVRVLGALRSTSLAPFVIWQRLRQTSMKIHIENDASTNTSAYIRALGQIDDPAASMLAARISAELSPEQQRAATYALGRVLGTYALPYLYEERAARQKAIKEETDQDYKAQYSEEIATLMKMTELGKEKGWFKRDLYRMSDPHAYDLQFEANKKSN